nr:hypothetical protein [Lactobacillus acidophilus]
MKKAWKYVVAVLIVIVGVFMLGMISGDNETAAPAGIAALYLILSGIFFYHNLEIAILVIYNLKVAKTDQDDQSIFLLK